MTTLSLNHWEFDSPSSLIVMMCQLLIYRPTIATVSLAAFITRLVEPAFEMKR